MAKKSESSLNQYRELKKNEARENPVLLPPPARNKRGTPGRGEGMGAGAMPRYRSADELEFAVDNYFRFKEETQTYPTMSGLALALGFSSVNALKRYEDKGDDYAEIVETARTRIECFKNELLLQGGKSTQGVIFDLINCHGWSNKVEQKTTVSTEGSLADLLQALQGNVLRPVIAAPQPIQEITDAEFTEIDDLLS